MKILAFLIFINICIYNALGATKPVTKAPTNVFREPLEEDEICPYHYCPSLKFTCAFDGKRYQYFRNKCYMLWHNYCFRGSEYSGLFKFHNLKLFLF